MKRKLILVLLAAVLALGSSLYADDSKVNPYAEASKQLFTAEDYEGEDLDLFNTIKETVWRPKAKGFLEHVSITSFAFKKSETLTFKSSGECWYKNAAAATGAVLPFFIKDGVITVGNGRLVYTPEKDQLEDMVDGRIYNRVGEKPAAGTDSTDTATVKQE